MGRPIYQKDWDKLFEFIVAELMEEFIEKVSGVYKVHEKLCRVDLAGWIESETFYAEVRRRTINYGVYEDYRIGHAKMIDLRLRARDCISMLVLILNDCIAFKRVSEDEKFKVVPSFGRNNKRDNYEREPSCVIPWSDIKPWLQPSQIPDTATFAERGFERFREVKGTEGEELSKRQLVNQMPDSIKSHWLFKGWVDS